MKRVLTLLLASLLVVVSLAGCRQIQKMLPASTVDNPAEGTQKYLIWKAIEAAQIPDMEQGWLKLRPLMHSSVTAMRTSEDNFLNLNFAAFRRKVYLFTPEDGKPTYKFDYTEEDSPDQEERLFIINEGSDMPSPFRVARDAAANNEWRLKNIP